MKLTKVEIKERDLELVVSEKTLGSLTTNARQIKDLVLKALPNYDISNYNESNIDQAKKDKAMLNNASKALNAKRIEFEKEFMKPFAEFKDVVSETVKLISECSSKIDSIVKQSEQIEKDKKKDSIKKYFEETGFTLVSFDKIFDEKWLNKTVKEKAIHTEIDQKVQKIEDDIKTLESIGEDAELLKSIYLDKLDINYAIQYANTLRANRERVKESSPTESVRQAETTQVVNSPNEIYVRAFKVTGTREDIIALSDFMNSRGIKFEKIDL